MPLHKSTLDAEYLKSGSALTDRLKISLVYLGLVDEKKSPGVFIKLRDSVASASEIAMRTSLKIYKPSAKGILQLLLVALKTKDDIVWLRFSESLAPFLFILTCVLRARGSKIVLEMPTPRRTGLRERKLNSEVSWRYILAFLSFHILGDWIFLWCNCVVQYGKESEKNNLFLRNKTLLLGNGISVDSIPLIQCREGKVKELRFIGLAQVSPWHGYDLFMRAMAKYNLLQSVGLKASFLVIGNGPALSSLKMLAVSLGDSRIEFCEALTGDALSRAISGCHYGVSSLAWHRVCLTHSSPIKTREYLARGLPVVAAGEDVDFGPDDQAYRYQVPSIEEIDHIYQFLLDLGSGKIRMAAPKDCRDFAQTRLDLSSRINRIFNYVLAH